MPSQIQLQFNVSASKVCLDSVKSRHPGGSNSKEQPNSLLRSQYFAVSGEEEPEHIGGRTAEDTPEVDILPEDILVVGIPAVDKHPWGILPEDILEKEERRREAADCNNSYFVSVFCLVGSLSKKKRSFFSNCFLG